ncbi:probable WRKY transcription factor 13 [Malania oleifera]|uniref:probable WRKY transcription factor 13 n=1 Tax=Malania oleifera TaxID=397392 RepID=UPI0025AE2218|nr:probable WRKY transcription factor 13 [Malania oleifera]
MSSATSQAMLNLQAAGLLEEQAEMGFFSFPPNNLLAFPPSFGCHQTLKAFPMNAPSSLPNDQALLSSATPKQKQDHSSTTSTTTTTTTTSHLERPHLLSLQRSSTANLWGWGEEVNDIHECLGSSRRGGDHMQLGVSAMKMKKIKGRRKVREPRFCFKTMSDVDVLDDGYKWRKYGQKVVKNTQHPRSYYRCTQDNCRVKKRVERLAEDPRMVITTYEGRHIHSPSHDDVQDDSHSPSHLTQFFW